MEVLAVRCLASTSWWTRCTEKLQEDELAALMFGSFCAGLIAVCLPNQILCNIMQLVTTSLVMAAHKFVATSPLHVGQASCMILSMGLAACMVIIHRSVMLPGGIDVQGGVLLLAVLIRPCSPKAPVGNPWVCPDLPHQFGKLKREVVGKNIRLSWEQQGDSVQQNHPLGKRRDKKNSRTWPNTPDGEVAFRTAADKLVANLLQGTSWKNMFETLSEFMEQLKKESAAAAQNAKEDSFPEPVLRTHGIHQRIFWEDTKNVLQLSIRKKIVGSLEPKHIAEDKLRRLKLALEREETWMTKLACLEKFIQNECPSNEADKLKAAAQTTYSMEVMAALGTLTLCKEDRNMHGLNLNIPKSELLVDHTPTSRNTFPAFRNVGNTCFVNSVLQVFMHTAVLRRRMRNPRPLDICNFFDGREKDKYEKLRQALHKESLLHSQRKLSIHVPLEILRWTFLLDGMLAGRQCDALDCFQHFNRSLGYDHRLRMGDEEFWFHIDENSKLQYPRLSTIIKMRINLFNLPRKPFAEPSAKTFRGAFRESLPRTLPQNLPRNFSRNLSSQSFMTYACILLPAHYSPLSSSS